MKNIIIKKVIGVILAGVILMYLFSGVAFAAIDINSDSFESIENGTTNTTSVANNVSTVNQSTNTTSTVNNVVKNNSVQNNTVTLPKTGSNNEFIFIGGLTILIGTTVFIYKKTKII